MDEIRCDEPSYLIWKWRPSGVWQGDNKRENAIRWGSSLRVKDGEVAVFVYKQKNGAIAGFYCRSFCKLLRQRIFLYWLILLDLHTRAWYSISG